MKAAEARSMLKKLGVTQINPMYDGRRIYAFSGYVPLTAIGLADYQRGASKSHITSMSKDHFILDCCLPLCVSLRPVENLEWSLWCYDGQHRIGALMETDYESHYCQIVFGLTYQQEADRFYLLNTAQRQMGGWVKFKAGYNARNPVLRKLIKLCEQRNLTQPITRNLPKIKLGDISSPNFLLWPYGKGGWPLVEAVLNVFDQCWRLDGDGPVLNEAKDAAMVRGLATFLKHHYLGEKPLPWHTIKLVLRNVGPAHIREEAKKIKTIRTDAKQYHEALCGAFGVDPQIKAPSCHLKNVA